LTENALTAILLTPEAKAEIAKASAERNHLAQLEELPDDAITLNEVLTLVQGRLSAIEEKRKGIVEPLGKAKAAIDALFRDLREPFEEAKERLKARLARLENERRALLAASTQAAIAARAEGDLVAAQIALDAAGAASVKPEGVSYRYAWDWEVEDLSKVPLEFLAVNANTVKLYTNRYKNSETIPPIPGLTFTKTATPIARG
jgi:hypothetical protein